MKTLFSKQEILDDLDSAKEYKSIINLEHPYVYTFDSRISLFADKQRWAIVFEKSGFSPREGATSLEVNYFGNCLHNLDNVGSHNQFISNTKYFTIIHSNEYAKIESDFELVSPEAKSIKIRNFNAPIEWIEEELNSLNIEIQHYDNPQRLLDFVSLNRLMNYKYNELFRATEEELRTCIPDNLPFIMNIDEWFQEPFEVMFGSNETYGSKPSEYETYQLIADVLFNQSSEFWRPSLEPNNHWSNWPEAGTM